MATPVARVSLPGGAWRRGVCHRDVLVHAVTGADELAALDERNLPSLAARVTTLLARCTEAVGPAHGEPLDELMRSLTIGDRETLLLHVRCLTFGDRIECVLSCPMCGAALESELSVNGLLVPVEESPAREWHDLDVDDEGGTQYHVRFRLPTGADQEAVAALATRDAAAAAQAMLRRCITDLRHGESPVETPPSLVADRIGALLPELDPQAELTLDLNCAVCGNAFTVLFDAASYLFQELEARADAVEREVHTLALHYHWSEADILAMSSAKRARYLDLIAESLGAGASA
jgi:hypothetical protein